MQGDAIVQSPPVPAFMAKDWAAAFSSQPGEFDYWIEEVEGTIPEYLQGTLFRNGPGNFGAPPQPIDPAVPASHLIVAPSSTFLCVEPPAEEQSANSSGLHARIWTPFCMCRSMCAHTG